MVDRIDGHYYDHLHGARHWIAVDRRSTLRFFFRWSFGLPAVESPRHDECIGNEQPTSSNRSNGCVVDQLASNTNTHNQIDVCNGAATEVQRTSVKYVVDYNHNDV